MHNLKAQNAYSNAHFLKISIAWKMYIILNFLVPYFNFKCNIDGLIMWVENKLENPIVSQSLQSKPLVDDLFKNYTYTHKTFKPPHPIHERKF
jgi:hypothetical protein